MNFPHLNLKFPWANRNQSEPTTLKRQDPDGILPVHHVQQPQTIPAYVMSEPLVLSNNLLFSPNYKFIRDYVIHWIRNPDPGSTFDKLSKYIRLLPDKLLLKMMMKLNYDGLLFSESSEIISHVFFQRHGDALHMFSISVTDKYQKLGFAEKSLCQFVKHAQSLPGINRVRLGGGGHAAIARICDKFKKKQDEMGIVVGEKGWIDLNN